MKESYLIIKVNKEKTETNYYLFAEEDATYLMAAIIKTLNQITNDILKED